MANTHEPVVHNAGKFGRMTTDKADPITTEVIRHALNSAANQMKRALIRTSFSPIIYEVLDFAVAIYDKDIRLLSQAPSLPMFMGTLSFCIDFAVKENGGPQSLRPGDALIYNWPFGTGSHPQDMVIIMPVFWQDRELIGYTAIKGHWLDIAAKDPYCTDTTDVFQEGVIFPGVKIYKENVLNEDIFRMIMANTRVPHMVRGDLDSGFLKVKKHGVKIGRDAEFGQPRARLLGEVIGHLHIDLVGRDQRRARPALFDDLRQFGRDVEAKTVMPALLEPPGQLAGGILFDHIDVQFTLGRQSREGQIAAAQIADHGRESILAMKEIELGMQAVAQIELDGNLAAAQLARQLAQRRLVPIGRRAEGQLFTECQGKLLAQADGRGVVQ